MSGILGFIAGLGHGYQKARMDEHKDKRAERGLQIHENVDERKKFWDDQQRNWREYMQTRPTPDGKSQWDVFWEDPNKIPDGPMSPIGDPSQPVTPPGTMEDSGPALEGEAETNPLPEPEAQLSQNSGPGASTGAAAPNGAIPIAPVAPGQSVATPAFNRIGRAAEGGPIQVGAGLGMGNNNQLWTDPNQQPALPMSPVGTEGLLDDPEALARQEQEQQFAAGMEQAVGWADQQPGLQPVERNASQMNLRGGGVPVQGAIDVRQSDPRMIQPQQQQWGRAAEGGPVEVMARFAEGGMAQVPEEGIPTQPGVDMSQSQSLQQSPATPQRQPSKYRDRLSAWQRNAENHAMMAGGLETMQKFRDMENATSRRAIMGYGLDAIRAMDEGNIGDAMRSGNSALESTPFDTGIKFEAGDGNLYMVGKDGKRGKPLTADHLRAFVEDNMKTPETYLDWKKQYEVERHAGETESVARKTAESGRISAEAQAETASFAGQRADAGTAQALAAVISSLSRRDAAAHARADELGWDPMESVQIIKGANDFFMDESRAITPEVGKWFGENPQAEGKFKSDVSQLILEQGPGRNGRNTMDFDTAAIVSQLIRQPGGIDLEQHAPDFEVRKNKETGELIAIYDGQSFRLPPGMYKDAMKNFKLVESPGEGGGKTDPPATTSQAGPRPAWEQEAIRMGEEDRLNATKEALATGQQEDQYRQATHS